MLEVAMYLLNLGGGVLAWMVACCSFGLFRYFLHRMKWSWALTGHMVLALVFGGLIVVAMVEIANTHKHTGPVSMSPEYGGSWLASEEQYKRSRYCQNGLMLIFGLVGWCIVAKVEDCKKVASEAKSAMHEAEANRLRAYLSAIEAQIEPDLWKAALKQAWESPNYLAAAELAERARTKQSVAEREI